MIRNVITLLMHDLAVAFKSKTLYLIVFIPLFVYGTLTMVDSTEGRAARMKIAFLQTETYAPAVLNCITQSPDHFEVSWASSEWEAMRLLQEHKVAGFLTTVDHNASRLQLTVAQQASIESLAILQRFTALQLDSEGKGPAWIAAVRPRQASSIQRQSLPTWILMMVLLVSFIVLPAQVAEEKEKQLLLGWMQTPVRESEWLVAKLVYGVVLMLISMGVLHLMSGEPFCAHALGYVAIFCVGGFCFGALGLCLGLMCRNQASARTMGVLCYLPMLLPAALSDMSHDLRMVAPWVPSYHLYEPIRAMLLEDRGLGGFTRAWIILLAIGLLACLASHRLIKKRWLM